MYVTAETEYVYVCMYMKTDNWALLYSFIDCDLDQILDAN